MSKYILGGFERSTVNPLSPATASKRKYVWQKHWCSRYHATLSVSEPPKYGGRPLEDLPFGSAQ
eukprot:14874438-Alexandrium_andersonii.AAC.1